MSLPRWVIITFIALGVFIYILISLLRGSEDENKILKKKIKSYEDKESEFSKKLAITKALLDNRERELNALDGRIKAQEEILSISKSNLSAIPFMARIIADYDTRGLDILAQQLNWGYDKKRLKKVKSILEIKRETKELIANYKEAEYQLAYALQIFPALEDFLCADYSQLQTCDINSLSSDNHDNVRNFLSNDEYTQLSVAERNQLALDRYRESRRKTNWQIGRDYELYVGYRYSLKGYSIDFYGSTHGLEDLGRDLIAKKNNITLIIQCKYWSKTKQIHEKHINQLYGTMVCYCFENDLQRDQVHGILVTNTELSDTAKKFASYLGIEIVENYSIGIYPCIKCNINRNELGEETKIYHLPFDQQYDTCKIDSPGEFYAMTVIEAEQAGFRRAYRWHSQ